MPRPRAAHSIGPSLGRRPGPPRFREPGAECGRRAAGARERLRRDRAATTRCSACRSGQDLDADFDTRRWDLHYWSDLEQNRSDNERTTVTRALLFFSAAI